MAYFLGRKTNYLYIWRSPRNKQTAVIVAPDADRAREIWSSHPYIVAGEPDHVYKLAGFSREQEMCLGPLKFHNVVHDRMTAYERSLDPILAAQSPDHSD